MVTEGMLDVAIRAVSLMGEKFQKIIQNSNGVVAILHTKPQMFNVWFIHEHFQLTQFIYCRYLDWRGIRHEHMVMHMTQMTMHMTLTSECTQVSLVNGERQKAL